MTAAAEAEAEAEAASGRSLERNKKETIRRESKKELKKTGKN